MQQRVAIAYRPSLLLMDEPFGSVDAQTREDLEDPLLRVRADTEMMPRARQRPGAGRVRTRRGLAFGLCRFGRSSAAGRPGDASISYSVCC
jgi:ABC-type phosphate transport system ATPase subunit